ncbi:MAG: polyprenyl synthetase family protein [Planctomycetota bacterium]
MSIANSASSLISKPVAKILPDLFAPIRGELEAVSERLQRELRHDDPFIDELAQHSFRLGGKRLRPAILLLAAEAVGEINDSHRVLATVVEMIHTATLIHDDVLDDASIRRHEATAKARWGNHASVLLGDYLFTHAFFLASTLDTTYGCRAIGRATNVVCEGELKQTAASGDFDTCLQTYFDIIQSKTASLCGCCCQLGAYYAGAESQLIDRLQDFGLHLGTAFQIADDLLDLEGEEEVTGKSLGTDIANRKMTLPLIHLRDQLESDRRRELNRLLSQPSERHKSTLVRWLNESGALDYSRKVAMNHVELAIDNLESLPASKSKETLTQIARFSAHRKS